jgi:hypothetical protein
MALRFIKINHIIIKKKMRWLELACGIFAIWLTREWSNDITLSVCQFITRLGGYPKFFIIPVGHMGYHHY